MSNNVKVYVRATSTEGQLTDEFNNAVNNAPGFAVFTDTVIKLQLFHTDAADSAFTQSDLSGMRFELWCDDDWNAGTSPKIGVQTGITVGTDGVLTIPMDTGNSTLIAWIGSTEEKSIKAELLGYDTSSTSEYANFCVQFAMKVRNRVFYTGSYTPSPVEGLYYTAAQSDARFAPISLVARVEDLEDEVEGVNSALNTLLS